MRLTYVAHPVRAIVIGLLLVPCIGVTPAEASCALPRALPMAIRTASSVFVGTVTDTAWEGRRATVNVEDVWRGEVSSPATVVGGGERTISSVDRKYAVGTTYLFVPYSAEEGEWQDNVCSNTQVYAADLARFRPAEATPGVTTPSPAPERSASQTAHASRQGGWALAAIALALAPVAVLLVRRRRKRSGQL